MEPNEQIKAYIIAAHANLDQVKAMLASDPDLLSTRYEWSSGDWENALQAAGHMGSRPIAEYLLAQGIEHNVYAAAMLGQIDEVERFLTEQPALGSTPGVHGFSLMWHAALSGSLPLAELVLRSGGAVTSHDLHAAVSQGHLEMVRWLMAHGAGDLAVKNFQGQTPVEVAQAQGHSAIADLLVQQAAS